MSASDFALVDIPRPDQASSLSMENHSFEASFSSALALLSWSRTVRSKLCPSLSSTNTNSSEDLDKSHWRNDAAASQAASSSFCPHDASATATHMKSQIARFGFTCIAPRSAPANPARPRGSLANGRTASRSPSCAASMQTLSRARSACRAFRSPAMSGG